MEYRGKSDIRNLVVFQVNIIKYKIPRKPEKFLDFRQWKLFVIEIFEMYIRHNLIYRNQKHFPNNTEKVDYFSFWINPYFEYSYRMFLCLNKIWSDFCKNRRPKFFVEIMKKRKDIFGITLCFYWIMQSGFLSCHRR